MRDVMWVVAGLLLGALLLRPVVEAQSRPPQLLMGRTSGDVNVPLRVSASGILSVN